MDANLNWTVGADVRRLKLNYGTMSFDVAKILQSKREFRQRLAAEPIEEKLAMLGALLRRSGAMAGQGGAHLQGLSLPGIH